MNQVLKNGVSQLPKYKGFSLKKIGD